MAPEIRCATDGRKDRWTNGQRSDIERWVSHLKKSIFPTECNSLWDEKKKRIVNQILLSMLWCIGQIYTILKFIKEKIEKTIAQLSIWKCGLSILEIDTRLNSRELK